MGARLRRLSASAFRSRASSVSTAETRTACSANRNMIVRSSSRVGDPASKPPSCGLNTSRSYMHSTSANRASAGLTLSGNLASIIISSYARGRSLASCSSGAAEARSPDVTHRCASVVAKTQRGSRGLRASVRVKSALRSGLTSCTLKHAGARRSTPEHAEREAVNTACRCVQSTATRWTSGWVRQRKKRSER
jgi:hypothetical protein